jgi:hypothetical protein
MAFKDDNEFLVARQRAVSGDPKPAAFCRQVRSGDTLDRFWPIFQAAVVIDRIVVARYFVVHCIFNLNINYSSNGQYSQERSGNRLLVAGSELKRKRPAGYVRAGEE